MENNFFYHQFQKIAKLKMESFKKTKYDFYLRNRGIVAELDEIRQIKDSMIADPKNFHNDLREIENHIDEIYKLNKFSSHHFNELVKIYDSVNSKLKFYTENGEISFPQRAVKDEHSFLRFRGTNDIRDAWDKINETNLIRIEILGVGANSEKINESCFDNSKTLSLFDFLRKTVLSEKERGEVTRKYGTFTIRTRIDHALSFIFENNTFHIFDPNGEKSSYLKEIISALKFYNFHADIISSPHINFSDVTNIYGEGTEGYCLAISLLFLESCIRNSFLTYQEVAKRLVLTDDIINMIRKYAAFLYETSREMKDAEFRSLCSCRNSDF